MRYFKTESHGRHIECVTAKAGKRVTGNAPQLKRFLTVNKSRIDVMPPP